MNSSWGRNLFKSFGVQLPQDKEANSVYGDRRILEYRLVAGDPEKPTNNNW
jgi:hypothetical protein